MDGFPLQIVDHGLEEDKVWAFKLTYFNQLVINNDYKNDLGQTKLKSNMPFWGLKLAAPHFFKKEKFEKMMLQWKWRMGLEYIKQRQAMVHNPNDQQLKQQHKREH